MTSNNVSAAFARRFAGNVSDEIVRVRAAKKKAPPKLSPQETRVYAVLTKQRKAKVCALYQIATDMSDSQINAMPHRRMQQHVGVIVQRLNQKRKKFVIVPAGKDEPGTYRIARRR